MKLRPAVLAAICSIVISSSPCSAVALDTASTDKQQTTLSDHYRQAMSVDPENPNLHYYLGMALVAEGRNHEAIAEFRRAYPSFLDSTEMNYSLGLAHGRNGDTDSALLYFDQAEALGALEQPWLFPLADTYYGLGVARLEEDDFEEAARLFSKVLSLAPDRKEIHHLLGDIYARAGQAERALAEFDAYLGVYPDDAKTREYVYTLNFNRALKFLGERDYRKARKAFDSALAATPGSPLAIYYIGYLDYLEERFEEAANRLAAIYSVSPAEIRQNMDSVLYNSALALLEQRKIQEALAAVAPLASSQPPSVKGLYLAGNLHLTLKEFERARICFGRVLTLDPSHRGATRNMVAARAGAIGELFAEGRSLLQEGAYRGALEKFESALSIQPAHPGARAGLESARAEMEKEAATLFSLAELSLRQSRPDESLRQISAALEIAPDSPRGRALRERAIGEMSEKIAEILEQGAALAAEGLLREADSAFAGVLELDPANNRAREERARIAHLLKSKATEMTARGSLALEDGRLAEAREAFKAALAFVPELSEGIDGLAAIEALLSAMVSEEIQWGRRAMSAGRLQQAREHFSNALRLRDDSDLRVELDAIDRHLKERLLALMDAAWISLAKGDFGRARNYFESALAQSPQHPEAHKGLEEIGVRRSVAVEREISAAEEALADGNDPRALSHYRRALEIDPASRKARKGVAQGIKVVKEKLEGLIAAGDEALADGLMGEAETALREALDLDPYCRDALGALRRLERLRDAGSEPGGEQRIFLRGIELYTRGKYEEAVNAWEKVLTLSPGHPQARLHIDKALRKLQESGEHQG